MMETPEVVDGFDEGAEETPTGFGSARWHKPATGALVAGALALGVMAVTADPFGLGSSLEKGQAGYVAAAEKKDKKKGAEKVALLGADVVPASHTSSYPKLDLSDVDGPGYTPGGGKAGADGKDGKNGGKGGKGTKGGKGGKGGPGGGGGNPGGGGGNPGGGGGNPGGGGGNPGGGGPVSDLVDPIVKDVTDKVRDNTGGSLDPVTDPVRDVADKATDALDEVTRNVPVPSVPSAPNVPSVPTASVPSAPTVQDVKKALPEPVKQVVDTTTGTVGGAVGGAPKVPSALKATLADTQAAAGLAPASVEEFSMLSSLPALVDLLGLSVFEDLTVEGNLLG